MPLMRFFSPPPSANLEIQTFVLASQGRSLPSERSRLELKVAAEIRALFTDSDRYAYVVMDRIKTCMWEDVCGRQFLRWEWRTHQLP